MNRGHLVLALLVVGLGTFFYFHDVQGKTKREEAKTRAARLFPNLKKTDVLDITVEHLRDEPKLPKFSRDIQHQRGLWVLQGTEPEVLGSTSLGAATKSLIEVQKTDDLAETPGGKVAPEEFGLDKPSYKISIKTKDGQTQVLLLGDKTPDGAGYYAQAGPSGRIERITTPLAELLDTPGDKMRETSPVPYEPSRVNHLEVSTDKGQKLVVSLVKPREKTTDDQPDDGVEITNLSEEWQLSSAAPSGPAATLPADGSKVRDLMWAWKNVKHVRFLKNSDKIDFSKPIVKVTAFLDGESEPFQFEVGPDVPGKPHLHYVRRRKPDEVMLVEINDLKLLEPSEASLQQRHLATFETEDVSRVAGHIDSTVLAASHNESGWKLQQPGSTGDATARDSGMSDLIWDLKNLEWKESSSNADWKDGPLVKEWKERAKMQLFDKKDNTLLELSIGPVLGKGALVKLKDGKIYRLETDPMPKWQGILHRIQGTATPTPTPTARPPASEPRQSIPVNSQGVKTIRFPAASATP